MTEQRSTHRDWLEDAAHENGKYQNTCRDCKQTFIGHKRRFLCRICQLAAEFKVELDDLQLKMLDLPNLALTDEYEFVEAKVEALRRSLRNRYRKALGLSPEVDKRSFKAPTPEQAARIEKLATINDKKPYVPHSRR